MMWIPDWEDIRRLNDRPKWLIRNKETGETVKFCFSHFRPCHLLHLCNIDFYEVEKIDYDDVDMGNGKWNHNVYNYALQLYRVEAEIKQRIAYMEHKFPNHCKAAKED